MKSTVVVVTFILFLLMSYSAKAAEGDHGGGADGGRAGVTTVPQGDVQSRLNELTSACLVGRPFPPRQAQIPVQPPVTQPPGDTAPTITNPITTPTEKPPVQTPPTQTPPPSNTAGRDILARNCVTCHHAGSTPESFKAKASEVERRLNLPTSDRQHMPQDKTLSESDKAAIISWVKGK